LSWEDRETWSLSSWPLWVKESSWENQGWAYTLKSYSWKCEGLPRHEGWENCQVGGWGWTIEREDCWIEKENTGTGIGGQREGEIEGRDQERNERDWETDWWTKSWDQKGTTQHRRKRQDHWAVT